MVLETTTLKILVDLLKPDRGLAGIHGRGVVSERVKALRHVAYIPENPILPQNLTVKEFLELIAVLRGIDASEAKVLDT